MRKSRLLLVVVAACMLIGVVFAGGLWSGYSLNEALKHRASLPSEIKVKLVGYYNSLIREGKPSTREVVTNRATLRMQTVYLPVHAADMGGGIGTVRGSSVLILDREGQFFHVEGTNVSQLALDVPENNIDALRAQVSEGRFGDGSVDIKGFRYNDTLHVEGKDHDYLLVSYSEWNPDDFCVVSVLARLTVPAGSSPEQWKGRADDWQIVKRTAPCLQPFRSGNVLMGIEAGGRLAQVEGSRVIWTSGSYEWDDRHRGMDFSTAHAQRNDSDYGKVLLVDFMTGETEIVARGLRNPQGLAMDAGGRIWVTDHGMRGGDELNFVFEGANFGHPAVSFGTRYNRKPAGNQVRHAKHAGYDLPVIAFVPSIGPRSAVAVEGFHYAWDGDVLVGGFDSIYRVHSEDRRAVYFERLPLTLQTRDMAMIDGGKIAIWTDDRRLVYLEADQGPDPMSVFATKIAGLTPESHRSAVSETFDACARCHGVAEGDHRAGPSLYGICGKAPGSTDFGSYSGALSRLDGVWTAERLADFIASPASAAPGNSMAWSGMEDRSVASSLGRLLCE